ncbi:MAG: PEP-CTERM sorting domain-containing protein [Planctomycetota bacterium]
MSFRDGLAADASDRLSYFREYCRFFRQMRYDGFSPSLTVVPEPATIGLLALGGLALRRSRRQAGRRR